MSNARPDTVMIIGQDALSGQLIDLSEGISMDDSNVTNGMALLSKGQQNPVTHTDVYGNVLGIIGYDANSNPTEAYVIMALDQYGMSHFDKVLQDGGTYTDGPFTTTQNMSIASDSVSSIFTVTP